MEVNGALWEENSKNSKTEKKQSLSLNGSWNKKNIH